MNQSKNNSTVDQAALLASMGGGGNAQDRLAALLERKLSNEYDEEQKKKNLEEAARLANLENIKRSREAEMSKQDACPHMKPNFQPALGGQKDHSGNYHFICQYCNKEFGNNVPFHLRISADKVGGPQ